MEWQKLGQIFENPGTHPKTATHAANPVAIHLEDDVFRIYYSGRDANNRSSVTYFDYDLAARETVDHATGPILLHGKPGSYYDAGVSIGTVFEQNGVQQMLFMGWQIPPGGHWRGDIGAFTLSADLSTVSAISEEPFLSTSEEDPVSLSYPCVLRENGVYKMWYGSTITWDAGNDEMLHVLNYASSSDATHWQRHGLAIPYELGVAQAFSRPTLARDSDGYHMWYSYRSGTGCLYRIGYAHSDDGLSWTRELRKGCIPVSQQGWDNDMVCYPFVFDHRGRRYMLYNGNGFGRSGIGLAILSS